MRNLPFGVHENGKREILALHGLAERRLTKASKQSWEKRTIESKAN